MLRDLLSRRQALLATGALSSFVSGQQKTPAAPPVNLADFELLAAQKLPAGAYEYLCGGSGDEITLRWNREAWDNIRLQPRVLVDVSNLETSVTLFGQRLPFPILLAPAAYHRLFHPDGELATVRGAGVAGALLVVSTAATALLDDISRQASAPLWFQLYIRSDRGITRELVHRAETAGCRALCVTVDSPVSAIRDRERRTRLQVPPGMRAPLLELQRSKSKGGTSFGAAARLTWKDVEWLRSITCLPVVLKGILSPDDALQAVRTGAQGIIVSNHGGRNLDTVPATAEVLSPITGVIEGKCTVLVDGGIRRGTDVLKALALGANAVLIGRPYLYGLAADGADGVSSVVNMLRREFELSMALAGCPSLDKISRSALWPVRP